MRKPIEGAKALTMTEAYRYSDSHLRFQRTTGAETALNRHVGDDEKPKYTAVLNRKSAYYMVPRDNLMTVVRHKLPPNLCKMKALTLQHMHRKTVGDKTGSTLTRERGMSQ